MSPDGHAAALRSEQLFEAGCELFADRGYHDVDVADITDHVGVSSGTFYNYYANKRALLDAILRAQIEGYAEAIGHLDVGDEVSSRDDYVNAFEQLIRRTLARIVANAPLASFLSLTAPGVDRDAYDTATQAFSTFSAQCGAFFQHGRDRGWVREDVNLTVAGRAAVSCMIMAVFPLLLGDQIELDVDAVSRGVSTYLLGGMRNA